jgi:periplasmic copper chaperone A
MNRIGVLLLLIAALFACTAGSAPLVASDIHISRPIPGTQTSAGYLTLTNNTDTAITITAVSSPEFSAVQMHESTLEDGISRMQVIAELTIAAGQSVRFAQGGKHLMLMRLLDDPDAVTLNFHSGDAIVLSIRAGLEG